MDRRPDSFVLSECLFADDAALVCSCREEMILAARIFDKVATEFGLTLSVPKMKLGCVVFYIFHRFFDDVINIVQVISMYSIVLNFFYKRYIYNLRMIYVVHSGWAGNKPGDG